MQTIRLKPGKEKPILNRHHWIFSGAITAPVSVEPGDLVKVVTHRGETLGIAYYNKAASLAARMIAFGEQKPEEAIVEALKDAKMLRSHFIPSKTNCYRLVNGEGDRVPGLIVDKYGDVLVLQVNTQGIEKLKPLIVEKLVSLFSPVCIYEKTSGSHLKHEGLSPKEAVIWGTFPSSPLEVLENGLKFLVDTVKGQKTGFFLDMREMRQMIRERSKNRKILNCCSYTGGFSVYALSGGALQVDSVDSSREAIETAQKNCLLNGFTQGASYFCEDVFDFLKKTPPIYDLIILDPPAFAKQAKDVNAACRGYKELNRLAFKKLPKHSMLLTASCSYFVPPALFQQVVFQAASEANRQVKIIARHQMAPDHPLNLHHPEGEYLKSLFLWID